MIIVKWGTLPAEGAGISFTLQPGASPSVGTIPLAYEAALSVPEEADFSFSDGVTTITLACKGTDLRLTEDENGKAWDLTFADRRWKWQYGATGSDGFISGTYNQPDGEGKPADGTDAVNHRSAQLLVGDCLEALGETLTTTALITNVPDDEYPPVDWDYENPARVMAELLESVGCIIALRYDDVAECHLLDSTTALPSGATDYVMRTESGEKAPLRPALITVRGDRKVVETTYNYDPTIAQPYPTFEAVGLDTDGDVKKVADLSYAPGGAGGVPGTFTFSQLHALAWGPVWQHVSLEAMQCAAASVYKWFRVVYSATAATNAAAFKKYLPWLRVRATVATEGNELRHAKPELRAEQPIYTTEFTKTADTTLMPDGWDLDHEHGILKFTEPMAVPTTDGPYAENFRPPKFHLKVAYERREADGADWYTYDYDATDAGNNPNTWIAEYGGSNCARIIVDEPDLVEYLIDPDATSGDDTDATSQNQTELDAWSLKRALAEFRVLKDTSDGATIQDPQSKVYSGVMELSPDGGVRNVTWTVNENDVSTSAQLGYDEPEQGLPVYKEKLRATVSAKREKKNTSKQKQAGKKTADGKDGAVPKKVGQVAIPGPEKQAKSEPPNVILIWNSSATQQDAGHLGQVIGRNPTYGNCLSVQVPDANNADNVVVIRGDLPANTLGAAYERGGHVPIKYTGTSPTTGEKVGSVSGQGEAEVSETGNFIVADPDAGNSAAISSPLGGASGSPMNDITIDGDSVVTAGLPDGIDFDAGKVIINITYDAATGIYAFTTDCLGTTP